MIHTIDLDEEDLELIFHALAAQEKKCKAIGNAGITGYGTASEKEKRQAWREKAEVYVELVNRLIDQTT
jgi:hypothetical protein